MESSLTVMKIQMPTGVEGYLEDLRQVSSDHMTLISNMKNTLLFHHGNESVSGVTKSLF